MSIYILKSLYDLISIDGMNTKVSAIIVGFATAFVYYLTILPSTKVYVSKFFIFYFLFTLCGFLYYQWAHKHEARSQATSQFIFLLSMTVLLWVGITGWYFSPFFYLLYLLGVLYAFIFSPIVTFVFVAVLSFLFLPNVGSIDLSFDIVTLLSLFSMVPLTYYLQKEYLHLKESEKKVLVLERENQKYKNKVEEVLSNQITRVSVDLKQPINDIKQTVLFLKRSEKTPKTMKHLRKMEDLVADALSQLDTFETRTTGKKLLHTKED